MARAVCKSCHKIHYWGARRGKRLKDQRCPKCGGELEAFRWDKHHRTVYMREGDEVRVG